MASSHQLHSYYDWQLSTLMLAYDAGDPIPRSDEKRIAERQQKIEQELYDLVQSILPEDYRKHPERDFPASLVVEITKATLRRAAKVAGLIE